MCSKSKSKENLPSSALYNKIHLSVLNDELYVVLKRIYPLLPTSQYKEDIERFINKHKNISCDNYLLNPIADITDERAVVTTEALQTKQEKLKLELDKFGFFTLELVRNLPENGAEKMIGFINSNKLPYKIAMLEYLGFIKHLFCEHFHFKTELYKGLSKILNTDPRSLKGNVLVLNPSSKENRTLYTADKSMERVEKDYRNIARDC